jgi:xylan 1,4-beta-xylosidase
VAFTARSTLGALVAVAGIAGGATGQDAPATWVADNGNGTYSNPLFFEEFSDPDVIRVGDDFYLTGTTMHTMPGLPVLHSKDLVNWELASYAMDRLDLDPSFRLEGDEQYGQGIWAPVIRHHNGTFYIFSNVNGFGTQVYRSGSPAGPWEHNTIETTLYDLSVLFDDDGKIYAVHRADDGVILEELNPGITDVVPGTRRVLMPRNRLGEGYKFYKIDGTYYLISAIPGAHTPMVAVRAPTLDGPWAYDTLVAGAHLGVHTGNALRRRRSDDGDWMFQVIERDPNTGGGLTLHQGAIVDTPEGEWWSIIMQDHRSLGRVSALVPVTWEDGWPYLGLAGNLRRPPRLWVKPHTGTEQEPAPLFIRDDNFESGGLNPIWQWNHVPVDSMWSVEEPGVLRLRSLPAPDLWWARNTLTQRAVGPVSTATVQVDVSGMVPGDVAGLALLNQPYAWIGLVRSADGLVMREYDQLTGEVSETPAAGTRFWLRAEADYETEVADLSYSTDGERFTRLGDTFTLVYQLVTFQGIRYSLFHYNTGGSPGGHVDFDDFDVFEPRPRGLTVPIPYGRVIARASLADGSVPVVRGDGVRVVPAEDPAATSPEAGFRVLDRSLGRVALQAADGRLVSVAASTGAVTLVEGEPGAAETFQWVDMISGDIMLLSLSTNRYLVARPGEPLVGNHPGPSPDHRDGSGFLWSVADI